MTEKTNKKILYAASTQSHLERFHQPYIKALAEYAEVKTMATGEQVDFSIVFDKHFFSFANLRSILKIRKILKREHFDAVLVHTTLAAFLIRAAMLGRKRPYVLNVVHGYLFSKDLHGIKDRILLLCEKLMRHVTDDIAVMNGEDMEIAKAHRLCVGNVFFINGMGVPFSKVLPKVDPILRTKFAPRASDFVCTFVGELSARKNQVFLIRSTRRLCDEGIPIKLILIGEGSEREMLQNEIKTLHLENSVFLTGTQTPVLPYLAITDLYVSASRSEGLPFNVMEAMSCGLPILASDTKGQNDLLRDNSESLYPLDDENAFCDAVRHVYASRRYGMGKKNYSVLKKYSLDAVFEENLKILRSGWKRDES